MRLEKMTLVLEDGIYQDSALTVEDGYIATLELGKKWQLSEQQALFPKGAMLCAGLIDLHGDMLEREIEPRPGSRFPAELAIRELDKRHVAAGITTAYVALSFASFAKREKAGLEGRTREMVSKICQLRPILACDTRIHARFEVGYPQAAPMLHELIEAEQVHLVSLMDHSPGQGQFRDLEAYVTYMAQWLQVSPEQAEREVAEQLAQPKAWDITRGISEIAQSHQLPLASHDDDSAEKVGFMHELGTTISEFPVTLKAAQSAKAHRMHVLMGAPNALRGGSHSGNLSALDALEAGALDALGSDYYPAAMLQAAFAIAKRGLAPLHEALALVTSGPAKAANLSERGALAVGKRADMVLLDVPENPQEDVQVVTTWQQGRVVYWSGKECFCLAPRFSDPI